MEWRSLKLVVASVVSIAVVTQVVRKIYKNLVPDNSKKINTKIEKTISQKTREINDVIMFSDNLIYHYIKVPPSNETKMCASVGYNSYKLLKYLKAANETLDVCMYLITSNEIAETIIRLGQKWVLVRLIVDGEMAYSGASQVKRLEKYSFIRVQSTKNMMHHKFCIIDGPAAIKRKNKLIECAENIQLESPTDIYKKQKLLKTKNAKGFVMSGSLNWSTQALHGSCDNVIVTSQPDVVHKFEKEFIKLWEDNELVSKFSNIIEIDHDLYRAFLVAFFFGNFVFKISLFFSRESNQANVVGHVNNFNLFTKNMLQAVSIKEE